MSVNKPVSLSNIGSTNGGSPPVPPLLVAVVVAPALPPIPPAEDVVVPVVPPELLPVLVTSPVVPVVLVKLLALEVVIDPPIELLAVRPPTPPADVAVPVMVAPESVDAGGGGSEEQARESKRPAATPWAEPSQGLDGFIMMPLTR